MNEPKDTLDLLRDIMPKVTPFQPEVTRAAAEIVRLRSEIARVKGERDGLKNTCKTLMEQRDAAFKKCDEHRAEVRKLHKMNPLTDPSMEGAFSYLNAEIKRLTAERDAIAISCGWFTMRHDGSTEAIIPDVGQVKQVVDQLSDPDHLLFKIAKDEQKDQP
jgi:uncharacterized small protein (DUF1192 family)